MTARPRGGPRRRRAYGPRIGEPKGITGGILHERQYQHGVRARGLRLDAFDGGVAAVPCTTPPADGAPGLYRGAGTVRGDGDGRLELPVWTRGFVWINGFGPGRLLGDRPAADAVRPGPELREGKNEM